jgi:hypothetical protein
MKAEKYKVGPLARKHVLRAIELLFNSEEDSVVAKFTKYHIRARRKPHGVELKWAKPGTFYNPNLGRA